MNEKNEIYHQEVKQQRNFNVSTRTLERMKTRKREVLIHVGHTFVGNLKETFKFGPRYVKQNQLN